MKIYNNNFEVINSGTLVSPNLNDTRFIVSDSPYMEIVFRIKKEGNENEIRTEVIDDNTLALIFTNPNGISIGPVNPVRVGKLNGKPLYVMFRVSMRSHVDSYELEYTFYREESE